jgi:hypothetical protein
MQPTSKSASEGRSGTLKQIRPLKTSLAASGPLSPSEPSAEKQPQRKVLAEAAIAKAVTIVALDRASAETSGQADLGAEASNSTEKHLRKPPADDDDLQNMAQILDRLNEVLKTKPEP